MPEESGSKYINPGGLWVFRKSQKISTASDEDFLNYVKKDTAGGKSPPPRGNRVEKLLF